MVSSVPLPAATPNYVGLVEFLVKPFLEFPDSLCVDCEQANQQQRVWIRLAFQETDKPRVFGRGGRNLAAIRAVLTSAAAGAGQSLYLDIYDGERETGRNAGLRRRRSSTATPESRTSPRRRPVVSSAPLSSPSV
ncbi:KH domain-containing protein [Synechocystis sp. LKSZ1]|uniref:KH domain-containing protein n=1 Tax=Synechocystis sp. LKSZ1 TaxID=3144951 RepID=UPI00336C0303